MVRVRAAPDERLVRLADRLVREGLLARGLARRLGLRGPALVPTATGRRVLRQLRAEPPAWKPTSGPSAAQVALDGTGRMADRALHAAVFVVPRPRRTPRRDRLHYYRSGAQADSASAYAAGAGHGAGAGGCGGGGCGG